MSESPTEHFEHAEHAEHVAHSGDPFLARVSITIAVLAVLSAAVGSLETIETAQTIGAKTTAAIKQNQATDQWGFFSRQSTKKTLYDLAADAATGAKADGYRAESKRYERESRETQKRAEELEQTVREENEASERHEHKHQVFTVSATLLHIAIAIATIAIVMRGRRWPYHTAVGLGILGVVASVLAYI
jgi:hypothetical protein